MDLCFLHHDLINSTTSILSLAVRTARDRIEVVQSVCFAVHEHSAATLNAGDVIMVGSMKTQDSLNTQHESYEGNNGSCTKNDGSVRIMYVNTVCTLASITVTDDWNTCYIGLPTTPTKWKWKNSNCSLLRQCNIDLSVQSLLHQFRNRTGDIHVVISSVWQVDNPKFPVCRCSCLPDYSKSIASGFQWFIFSDVGYDYSASYLDTGDDPTTKPLKLIAF